MHRVLRVVEVEIETAGGQGAEAKLSVLAQAEATRLRQAIFARRNEGSPLATDAAAAPATTAIQGPPRGTLRRVTTGELVLAGLTSNQLASGLAVVVLPWHRSTTSSSPRTWARSSSGRSRR